MLSSLSISLESAMVFRAIYAVFIYCFEYLIIATIPYAICMYNTDVELRLLMMYDTPASVPYSVTPSCSTSKKWVASAKRGEGLAVDALSRQPAMNDGSHGTSYVQS
jgi:hypothetical protein